VAWYGDTAVQTGHHFMNVRDSVCLVKWFDLFVLETHDDVSSCAESGIFDFSLFDLECENCSMSVGPTHDEGFIPVAIVSDQIGSAWPICVDCAAPMIFPGDWFDR